MKAQNKSIITSSLLIIIFTACQVKVEKEKNDFNAFTIGWTYANNNICKIDSLEMTNTICLGLIHFDNSNYAYAYRNEKCEPIFYKGNVTELAKEKLRKKIIELHNKYPFEHEPVNNHRQYCAPSVNIILESDSLLKYHAINYYSDSLYILINEFIDKNLTKSNTIEQVLMYKYYITSKMAYYIRDSFNMKPVNSIYFPLENIPFRPPIK